MFRTKTILTLAATALMAAAASAQANANPQTIFAGVGGSKTASTCTFNAPCSIEHAADLATSGDDVAVKPGSYNRDAGTLSNYITVDSGITLHGIAGMARPTIKTATPMNCSCGLFFVGDGATLRDVIVKYEFPGDSGHYPKPVVMEAGGTLDGVEATGTDAAVDVINGGTGSITRSTLRTTATGATAALGINGTFSNITINVNQSTLWGGAASSYGLEVRGDQGGPGTFTIANIHNSIVRGGTSDVHLVGAVNKFGIANFNHSSVDLTSVALDGPPDYSGVTDNGTNLKAAPLLANPNADDFHQLAGSNTINAGTAPFPGLDADGTAFGADGTPDIGADEYVAPATPGIAAGARTLKLAKPTVKAKRKKGKAVVKITCPKTAVGSCTGTLSLKQGSKTKTTKVKAIQPGKSATLNVKAKKGKSSITVTLTDGSGASGAKAISKKLK